MTDTITIPRATVQQGLEALAIADNIALVGAAYTPKSIDRGLRKIRESATALRKALEQPEQEPVTILPDGSAFGVMSFPLPDDHWLYAPNEYRDGEYEPIDLPKPILTHALREAVVASVRYAVRGATMRGQETDFDPDALVRNAVYALCGPYTTPPAAQRKPLTDEEIDALANNNGTVDLVTWWRQLARAIEAKLKEWT
jgi:hypothetical protein